MSGSQQILVFQPSGKSKMVEEIQSEFDCLFESNEEACLEAVNSSSVKVVVLDLIAQKPLSLEQFSEFLKEIALDTIPVIIFSPSSELQYKLKAFELGCDDVITIDDSVEEAKARITKSIFNVIANEQLKSRLDVANETAFTAMSDISDLGTNLNFLVEENRCNNLDELGQLLFVTLERYGLSCSLQMRSLYGVKNMEANGMAKELESQLLDQMQNAGRFIDFGRRTIINFGRASLLVRNMPVEDSKRYGSLKDNLFALLKGLEARVKALDSRNKILEEKNALHKLSSEVREVMTEIDMSYQQVMRDIATVVEDMADAVQNRIPELALSEEQEQFIEEVVNNCVVNTNRIFNEGLKVDESFNTLCDGMDKALEGLSFFEESEVEIEPDDQGSRDQGMELF